ncbi:MAG: hypothetical protein H6710_07360 [Myxococcales bacterium]|nr:hypothetical protein [Myxococcales bacterium]MCB9704080.1 hypothetical protein [Myxococcales bacterium]
MRLTPNLHLDLDSLNLEAAERTLCVEALNAAGTIIEAAALLGVTRHALKRRIIKHKIEWPVRRAIAHGSVAPVGVSGLAAAGSGSAN